MATKSTNSTIITVGVLAIVAYIAWRYFGGAKKVSAATGASSPYVPGSYGNDYPDQYAATSTNPLQSALNSLLNGIGVSSKPGSQSGQSSNANNPNSAQNAASQYADNSTYPAGSIPGDESMPDSYYSEVYSNTYPGEGNINDGSGGDTALEGPTQSGAPLGYSATNATTMPQPPLDDPGALPGDSTPDYSGGADDDGGGDDGGGDGGD